MDRREALRSAAALLGTLIGAEAFLTGCTRNADVISGFDDKLVALLDDIGEAILPATAQSPGAKAAAIGAFMKTMVTDCYSDEERAAFFSGVTALQQRAMDEYGDAFGKLPAENKQTLLAALDQEARSPQAQKPHVFDMLNQLTVWGYFSSEPGATRALRYVPIPGRYEGCIDYNEGEGAWLY